jgi:hypothetical protein
VTLTPAQWRRRHELWRSIGLWTIIVGALGVCVSVFAATLELEVIGGIESYLARCGSMFNPVQQVGNAIDDCRSALGGHALQVWVIGGASAVVAALGVVVRSRA